ncbi:uncharacterized protein BXZ73DRAFT_78061 [Epithele typhae]|uniref:uncharacterized protein n=1 Tax=Epithele typhae TaxID=378194 RepID=UPI0020080AFE|nr:uncharacterized protein BXZ73DRAFT_78061 [Epithele typhae]KAH9929486.1 hypothetical protein BXZ73DRAFT_78061 [Epithele typhae]
MDLSAWCCPRLVMQENPFHQRVADLRASTSALTASTNQENFADPQAGECSADSVAAQLAALSGLPDYIRKLERRDRAAQRSLKNKTQKIGQLEGEVHLRDNHIRTLEATVAQLQARQK